MLSTVMWPSTELTRDGGGCDLSCLSGGRGVGMHGKWDQKLAERWKIHRQKPQTLMPKTVTALPQLNILIPTEARQPLKAGSSKILETQTALKTPSSPLARLQSVQQASYFLFLTRCVAKNLLYRVQDSINGIRITLSFLI